MTSLTKSVNITAIAPISKISMLPFSLHRFECTCTAFDHNIRLDVDEELGTISLSVPLNHWRSWYHRIWLATKFIFGITERYGHYDTIELNPDDYGRIRSLLDESERILKEQHEASFPRADCGDG